MSTDTEAFYAALDDLDRALADSVALVERMRARIDELRAARAEGRSLGEVVRDEEPPLVVQLLTDSAGALQTYGTRVRRAEARALHAEGMTMEEIAHLFGVSRQRVSALLRGDGGSERPRPGRDDG